MPNWVFVISLADELVRLLGCFVGGKCKDFFLRAKGKRRKCFRNGAFIGEIWLFLQREKERNMTIPYDSIEDSAPSMASEPQVAYGNATQFVPRPYSNDPPDGFMTLERFGELFHQKLDACYARLQSNSEQ